MFDIDPNSTLNLVLLCFACVRLYLELINFDFTKLPIGQAISRLYGPQRIERFHRFGLFVTIGYIVFMAPPLLFS